MPRKSGKRISGFVEITVPADEVLGTVCQICGSDKNLIIHHKNHDPLNNDSRNLMLVCRKCHAELHKAKPYISRMDVLKAYQWFES